MLNLPGEEPDICFYPSYLSDLKHCSSRSLCCLPKGHQTQVGVQILKGLIIFFSWILFLIFMFLARPLDVPNISIQQYKLLEKLL